MQKYRAIIDSLPPDKRQQFAPDPQTLLGYIVLDQGIPTDASFKIEPVVVNTIAQATLPPGASIEVTGNTPLNYEIAVKMTINFVLLVIAAILLMLMMKYLLWSKIRYWILPVVLLTFGLFYTFGIMGILGIPANDGDLRGIPHSSRARYRLRRSSSIRGLMTNATITTVRRRSQ